MSQNDLRLEEDYIVKLLVKSLTEKDAQLDLWGMDRKVLLISHQDLLNYLKFHWNLHGEDQTGLELKEKIYNCVHERPAELKEFMDFWAGLWIKKWKERVKVLIGQEDNDRWVRIHELLEKAEPVWGRLKNREEMLNLVTDALIRNGEICGTSILAENTLKVELGLSLESKVDVDDYESLLKIVNKVLKEVREISRSKGPLILLRIDKRFFHYS